MTIAPGPGRAHRIVCNGHELLADLSPEMGGRGGGPEPYELVVAGAASAGAEAARSQLESKGFSSAGLCLSVHYRREGQALAVDLGLALPGPLPETEHAALIHATALAAWPLLPTGAALRVTLAAPDAA